MGGAPPPKLVSQSRHVLETLEFYNKGGRSVFSQRYIFERDLHIQRLTEALTRFQADQVFESFGRDPDSLKRQERRQRKRLAELSPIKTAEQVEE